MKPDPRVTIGAEQPCLTQPPAENRYLLKRMSGYAPGGKLLVQDLGEMDGDDHWGHHYSRTSDDQGRTRSAPLQIAPAFQNASGRWVRMGESTFLEEPDFLSRIFNLHEYPTSGYASEIWWHNRLMIQEWNPSIQDFAAAQPLAWDFPEADLAQFWTYGQNALGVSFSRPFVTRNKRIILPAQWIPDLPEYKGSVLRFRAGCLIGQRSAVGLQWRPGGFVDLSPQHSTRGVFESAMAELVDGRLLLTARASNDSSPHLPAHKWMAQSSDGGATWSAPTPLTWNDGTPLFSSSSGSALIRASSGILYWLGNIAPERAVGNRPRHPLLLVRVREDATPTLDRSSVVVIDCRLPEDSESVQLSNFKVYEDRKSQELVITYARLESRGAGMVGEGSVERRILL